VVVTTSPFVAPREGKGDEQPMLQAFNDAEAAGIHTEYVDALNRSGARYIITTGRDIDAWLPEYLPPRFEREKELDLRIQSLYSWDEAKPAVLWRRALTE
jgi:hypothetical protein